MNDKFKMFVVSALICIPISTIIILYTKDESVPFIGFVVFSISIISREISKKILLRSR